MFDDNEFEPAYMYSPSRPATSPPRQRVTIDLGYSSSEDDDVPYTPTRATTRPTYSPRRSYVAAADDERRGRVRALLLAAADGA